MPQPILHLSSVRLGYGAQPLFENLSLTVHAHARIALVGRNGSGKSSLLRLLAGHMEPDSGSVARSVGVKFGYMPQEPVLKNLTTLGDIATDALAEEKHHLALRFAEKLKFDPQSLIATASGGQIRRAALAALLSEEPDLLLMDEPTNHLDIEAISWLEEYLLSTRQAMILISHDRRFLSRLTDTTLWLDRGQIYHNPKGFAHFENWRDKIYAEADAKAHKLEKKIQQETQWAAEGISARRRRNQGRLRALSRLRDEQAMQNTHPQKAGFSFGTASPSGRVLIAAENVNLRFTQPILANFSTRILRGERIGIIGPNGIGKTTLLKILMKEIAPDSGEIVHGTRIEAAVFDQKRAILNPQASVWETLTLSPEIGVSGRSDQVMVQGKARHVLGYLKDFLFDAQLARAKISSLSGGEQARLLLAKLMAKESNLIVLDEPTNDLDIESLDLLQEVISDYAGSVLLISHDRDFLDRVATRIIAFEGNADIGFYAGGWSDYQSQRRAKKTQNPQKQPAQIATIKAAQTAGDKAKTKPDSAKTKPRITFTERHRLQEIPEEIALLQAEIAQLEKFLNSADIFTQKPEKAAQAGHAISVRTEKIKKLEDMWLELAEKAENS